MAAPARVAVYYAPPTDDPLAAAGAAWLGRDAEHHAPQTQPLMPDIAALTEEPRRYGFHATLKPPMRLAAGRTWEAFTAAARALADAIAPFALPRLRVADLHGFLALREIAFCAPLQALCDRCVAELDSFREPPDAAELQRRRRARLTAEQDAMLERWGYPYVFQSWFFHMTLTRRLSAEEKAIMLPAAEAFFAEAVDRPRWVRDICLFVQPTLGADFVIAERLLLRG